MAANMMPKVSRAGLAVGFSICYTIVEDEILTIFASVVVSVTDKIIKSVSVTFEIVDLSKHRWRRGYARIALGARGK